MITAGKAAIGIAVMDLCMLDLTADLAE